MNIIIQKEAFHIIITSICYDNALVSFSLHKHHYETDFSQLVLSILITCPDIANGIEAWEQSVIL